MPSLWKQWHRNFAAALRHAVGNEELAAKCRNGSGYCGWWQWGPPAGNQTQASEVSGGQHRVANQHDDHRRCHVGDWDTLPLCGCNTRDASELYCAVIHQHCTVQYCVGFLIKSHACRDACQPLKKINHFILCPKWGLLVVRWQWWQRLTPYTVTCKNHSTEARGWVQSIPMSWSVALGLNVGIVTWRPPR